VDEELRGQMNQPLAPVILASGPGRRPSRDLLPALLRIPRSAGSLHEGELALGRATRKRGADGSAEHHADMLIFGLSERRPHGAGNDTNDCDQLSTVVSQDSTKADASTDRTTSASRPVAGSRKVRDNSP
jgi:hypothetical protein